jgi:hypothetical protein
MTEQNLVQKSENKYSYIGYASALGAQNSEQFVSATTSHCFHHIENENSCTLYINTQEIMLTIFR